MAGVVALFDLLIIETESETDGEKVVAVLELRLSRIGGFTPCVVVGRMETNIVVALEGESLDANAKMMLFCAGLYGSISHVIIVLLVSVASEDVEFLDGLHVEFGSGGEVAKEFSFVDVGVAVGEVDNSVAVVELELIAEADDVEIFSLDVLLHIDGVDRSEATVLSVPDEIVAETIVAAVEGEDALSGLEDDLIVFTGLVAYADTESVRQNLIAVGAVLIDIDRSVVVLVTADVDNLLTSSNVPLFGGLIVEIEVVGGLEEAAFTHHVLAEALTIGIGELIRDFSVEFEIEVLATEAGIGLITVDALVDVLRTELKLGVEPVRLCC